MTDFIDTVQIFGSPSEKAKTVYRDSKGNLTVREGGDPNWRNNNPGNIKYVPVKNNFATRHGAIGFMRPHEPDPSKLAIFSDLKTGLDAQDALIRNNYMGGNIRDAILKYANQTDNPPSAIEAKTRDIPKRMNLSPETPMKALTPEQFDNFKRLMTTYEGRATGREYTLAAGSPEAKNLWVEGLSNRHLEDLNADDVKTLMASESYWKPSSPLHKKIQALVRTWHEQTYMAPKTAPPALPGGKPVSGGPVHVRAYIRDAGKTHVHAYDRSKPAD